MNFGIGPAWHALPPRQVAPAWHPAPQSMVIRPRYVPVVPAPRPVFTRFAPQPAPPPPMWRNPREFQRQHDDAFRLVQERQRNAVLASRLASQQNTANAQQQAAVAQAQLVAAQQALAALQAQQATAQASTPGAVVTAPAPSPVVMQPSMPAPQPDVSPGNATQDMGPTQDAAAAAAVGPAVEAAGDEHPGHAMGRKIVIGLVIVGLGIGGYMFVKKSKKSGGSSSGKSHAPSMHGFRRRGRRRR